MFRIENLLKLFHLDKGYISYAKSMVSEWGELARAPTLFFFILLL